MQLLVRNICSLAVFETFNRFAVIDLVDDAILMYCVLAAIQGTKAIYQRLVTISKAAYDFCANVRIRECPIA